MEGIFGILAGSLAVLTDSMAPASAPGQLSAVNLAELFAQLNAAVAAFDPAAIDLLDQLLASVGADSELAQQLTAAREMLDNFDFGGAAPVLAAMDIQAAARG